MSSCWTIVDQQQQIVSRELARDAWPWLEVEWSSVPTEDGLYLEWTDSGLSLKSATVDARSSVRVDFCDGPQARRLKAVTGEALTRAIGCQKGLRPSVCDATAGLGSDASVLANVGCLVTAIERSDVVAALLADGLRRASLQAFDWCERIELMHADAVDYLARLTHGVVYLDPMFAQERKAQPGLAMQLLHQLPTNETSADTLFFAAIESQAARVVVKRPLKAPPLGGREPGSQIRGKTIRFDLYARRKLTAADMEPIHLRGRV
jgi:16S rRNA (guanine1516-N2)-methyltransferase